MVKLYQPIKKQRRAASEANERKLYAIHHLHHVMAVKGAKHELHHCVLFAEKDLAGQMHRIIRVKKGAELFHCLKDKFTGKLYDHANRSYKITPIEIKNKKRYAIEL